MLHTAAAANSVTHDIGNRHIGLTAGIRISDGRLVDNLWNGFVRKRRGADIDQRSQPSHGSPRCDPAEAQFGDRRALDPANIFLPQACESRMAGPGAYEAAADQYDSLILRHDFLEADDERFSEGHFLRHG